MAVLCVFIDPRRVNLYRQKMFVRTVVEMFILDNCKGFGKANCSKIGDFYDKDQRHKWFEFA